MKTKDPKAMDHWRHVVESLPFIGLMAGGPGPHQSPALTRLIEAAIIGGIVLYGTVQVLDAQIKAVHSDLTEIKKSQSELRHYLYTHHHEPGHPND